MILSSLAKQSGAILKESDGMHRDITNTKEIYSGGQGCRLGALVLVKQRVFLSSDLCDSLQVEFCCVQLGVYKLNSKLLEADPSFDAPSALMCCVFQVYGGLLCLKAKCSRSTVFISYCTQLIKGKRKSFCSPWTPAGQQEKVLLIHHILMVTFHYQICIIETKKVRIRD